MEISTGIARTVGQAVDELIELRARLRDVAAARGATGLASSRAKVFEGFPRSGIPPAFGSFEEFEELIERGMRTHCFPEYTHVWWDVRPHPALGTVELRVCDAQIRIASVGAVAALTQALVATFAADLDHDRRPLLQPELLAENTWRATRDGLRAGLIDLERDTERPASEAGRALIDRSRPGAKRCGCEPELDEIERLLARGSGADEQLRVYEETGDVRAVAAWVAEETARSL